MHKIILVLLLAVGVVGAAGGAWYYRSGMGDTAAASTGQPAPAVGRGAAGGRAPLTVDSATATKHEVVEYVTVVGNLIGEATVDIVPRVAGRIESIAVKMGDRVTKGQQVAKMEDREIREQINGAVANLDVNKATVVSRESDMKVAEATLGRQKGAFAAGVTTKQNVDEAEARYNSTVAQVQVAKAQQAQTQARLDELNIGLVNTTVISPVDGFVSRRVLDPGAFAGGNTVVLSVVDISLVRLVANLVEKDFRRVQQGADAVVGVDAFQGEKFRGVVSRVAPVFDAATRTAVMEIEVPNPGFRLKPGMYARVQLTAERHVDALTVPRNAVVDLDAKRGVYVIDGPPENQVARFRQVRTGLQDDERLEVLEGLDEGERVVTMGAISLRDGDKIKVVAPGRGGRGGRGGQ